MSTLDRPTQKISDYDSDRDIPFTDGAQWIASAWDIFKLAPAVWIGVLIVFFIISVVLGMIPVLGNIAFQFIAPMVMGGIMYSCKELEYKGEINIETLTAGFREKMKELFILGLFYLLFAILMVGVLFLIVGATMFSGGMAMTHSAPPNLTEASLITMLVAVSVVMIMALLFVACTIYAIPLIMFHDITPVTAMKESFFACFKNIGPMFLYGVLMTIILFVSMIPLGLGLLVSIPIMMIANYTSYKAIFLGE